MTFLNLVDEVSAWDGSGEDVLTVSIYDPAVGDNVIRQISTVSICNGEIRFYTKAMEEKK